MILTSRPGLLLNLLLWLAVTAFGAYLLTHIKQFINFGIDLVGGTYLTLDVKVEEAYKHELMSISDDFIDKLKAQNLIFRRLRKFQVMVKRLSLNLNLMLMLELA